MLVDLNLNGKQVIIIGGGTEGLRKLRGLEAQNCEIILITNRLNRIIRTLRDEGKIHVRKEHVRDTTFLEEYDHPFLIMACTNDKALNRTIAQKARLRGVLSYAVDDPAVSEFSYASIINIEGILQIAISTSGRSPIVARTIRIKAERVLRRLIRRSDIDNIKLQEVARKMIRTKIPTVNERKEFLYSIFNDSTIQKLIKEDRIDDARQEIVALINSWKGAGRR
ncbi:MAG TPA: bifunctional precorrin-2 dehydrogenase/sirohydrochlorin ferrochelatase [Nitrososphaeraceae archaeon]|nr:bifunctional precorrin-2 dehydrogenase/sirohydrochlorin ferrochelatase [Nitrososphaeraceae archaeon]